MIPSININEGPKNLFNQFIIEEIKGKDDELKFELLSNNQKLE